MQTARGSNVAATIQQASAHSASYLSAGTSSPHTPFPPPPLPHPPPGPCSGLVPSDGSASFLDIAPHNKVHCSFPASPPPGRPVSQSITWGFHPAPDYTAYPASTSPQLRCWQLEMTITYAVIVGCAISPRARADSLCLRWVKGGKVSDISIFLFHTSFLPSFFFLRPLYISITDLC